MARKTAGGTKGGGTILRTFRIPRGLDEVIAADAKKEGKNNTDLLVSILTRYVGFDRYAEKFGFITLNRRTFQALVDAIPVEKLREIARSQAGGMEDLMQFWFKKSDAEAVLGAIDIFSKYLRGFEYTTSMSSGDVVVVMKSELGMNATIFAAAYWEEATSRALGVAPKVETRGSTVILRFPMRPNGIPEAGQGFKEANPVKQGT